MKICFFTTDFPPMVGGISSAALSYAHHISKHSDVNHVQVIALKNPEEGVETPHAKLSIVRDKVRHFFPIARKVLQYSHYFRNYDVFHAVNIFPVGFLVLIIGKYVFRKPVVVSFYGADVLWEGASFKTKLAIRFTLKLASRALAFSNATATRAGKHFYVKPEHFAVIYYPFEGEDPTEEDVVNASLIRKRLSIAEDDFIVLFVGNLFRYKGGEYLIRAVHAISDTHVKLIFIGNGPDGTYFENLVQELTLRNRVFFTGKVSSVVPYYLLADLFSMPSYFDPKTGDVEGLGIVYLEAQYYGLPVLGTRSGGIVEALEEGGSGFLVPEHDAKALEEKILILRDNKELRKRMGMRGKAFVEERFNPKKSADAHVALYKKLVYEA